MSFARQNLAYSVRLAENAVEHAVREVLEEVPGSSIVYVRSRRGTRELAEQLAAMGVSTTFYHAGLTNKEKTERAAAWQRGDVRVIVATNAFGMGIDKPDVRSVIHADVPTSPEAYFQEAGRAGRDGRPATAVLIRDVDSARKLKGHIVATYPPEEYVTQVYEDICCFLQLAMGDGFGITREFNLDEFCRAFQHFPVRAYNAILLLDRAGYITWTDAEENRSRVLMTCRRDDLYDYHLPPLADRLVHQLLRTCTGIFAEYVYINEETLAADLGVGDADISEQLILLSRMHVLSFIPRKFIPYITFVQRRVEREDIVLPAAVYADRKHEMEQRVQTMLGYLTTNECRSRYLLAYFGEKAGCDCGLCDNCREVRAPKPDTACTEAIKRLLRSRGPLAVHEIRPEGFPQHVVAATLHQLLLDEVLTCKPGTSLLDLC